MGNYCGPNRETLLAREDDENHDRFGSRDSDTVGPSGKSKSKSSQRYDRHSKNEQLKFGTNQNLKKSFKFGSQQDHLNSSTISDEIEILDDQRSSRNIAVNAKSQSRSRHSKRGATATKNSKSNADVKSFSGDLGFSTIDTTKSNNNSSEVSTRDNSKTDLNFSESDKESNLNSNSDTDSLSTSAFWGKSTRVAPPLKSKSSLFNDMLGIDEKMQAAERAETKKREHRKRLQEAEQSWWNDPTDDVEFGFGGGPGGGESSSIQSANFGHGGKILSSPDSNASVVNGRGSGKLKMTSPTESIRNSAKTHQRLSAAKNNASKTQQCQNQTQKKKNINNVLSSDSDSSSSDSSSSSSDSDSDSSNSDSDSESGKNTQSQTFAQTEGNHPFYEYNDGYPIADDCSLKDEPSRVPDKVVASPDSIDVNQKTSSSRKSKLENQNPQSGAKRTSKRTSTSNKPSYTRKNSSNQCNDNLNINGRLTTVNIQQNISVVNNVLNNTSKTTSTNIDSHGNTTVGGAATTNPNGNPDAPEQVSKFRQSTKVNETQIDEFSDRVGDPTIKPTKGRVGLPSTFNQSQTYTNSVVSSLNQNETVPKSSLSTVTQEAPLSSPVQATISSEKVTNTNVVTEYKKVFDGINEKQYQDEFHSKKTFSTTFSPEKPSDKGNRKPFEFGYKGVFDDVAPSAMRAAIMRFLENRHIAKDKINMVKNGKTLLMQALTDGELDVAKYMLVTSNSPKCQQWQTFTNLNHREERTGNTILTQAIELGHLEVASLVLRNSSFEMVNAKTKLGLSPYHLALAKGFPASFFEELLNHPKYEPVRESARPSPPPG